MLLLALLLQLVAAPPADTTQTTPDTLTTREEAAEDAAPVRVRFLPILGTFYTPSKGIGVGGGIGVENLGAPGTDARASVEVMERFGRVRASFFTGDRYYARRFVGVRTAYTRTSVRPFYGLGPRTERDHKVWLSMESVEVELRAGIYPFADGPFADGRLLVQPVVRLLHDDLRSFEAARDSALVRLDLASLRNLRAAEADAGTGLTYGLEIAYDTRNRADYPNRGVLVLLTGRRYDGLGDAPFRYGAGTGSFYGFAPLGGRHVLAGRAVLALTRRIGERSLPFHALPVLDERLLGGFTYNRFIGHDLVALSAEYRFPIFDVFGWYGVDGALQVHLANAYDDVFEQFEAGVSFERDLDDDGGRVPLRPAAALGARIVNLDEGRVVIGGQLGLSAEGYAFGSLDLVYDLRALRPLVR